MPIDKINSTYDPYEPYLSSSTFEMNLESNKHLSGSTFEIHLESKKHFWKTKTFGEFFLWFCLDRK